MNRPVIFAELFAGSAAVSLQLIGGTRLRPPVAYMGSKASLAPTILGAMGLTPGQGADRVVLCDAGPWGWVWQALAVPETARAVAGVLRGWSGEDPTALWRRLAAEPPPDALVERAASTLWIQGRTPGNVATWWDGARWVMADAPGRSSTAGPAEQRTGTPETSGVGLRSTPTVAARVDGIAGAWKTAGYAHLSDSARAKGFRERLRPDLIASGVDGLADGVASYLAMQAHAPNWIPVWPGAGGGLAGLAPGRSELRRWSRVGRPRTSRVPRKQAAEDD